MIQENFLTCFSASKLASLEVWDREVLLPFSSSLQLLILWALLLVGEAFGFVQGLHICIGEGMEEISLIQQFV